MAFTSKFLIDIGIPSFIRDLPMSYFMFTIGVVWTKDKDSRTSEDGAIIFTDYDSDYISGKCDSTDFWFVISDRDKDDLKVFNTIPYVTHLNRIQKVLNVVEPSKFDIRPMYDNFDLLELGILNKNDTGFYSIDDESFEKIERLFTQKVIERSKEQNKAVMSQIEEQIMEYKEMEAEGDLRAKEKRERLNELKNVMETLSNYGDDLEESNNGEE